MARGVKAAIVYFAIVFAAGFLLGTMRVLALAPLLGERLAVLFELPIMLAISWFACARIVNWFCVPGLRSPRLVMGGAALALLMFAEMGVSVFAFGRTIVQHLEAYRTAAALLGLMAQIAFALFPVIQSSARLRAPAGRISWSASSASPRGRRRRRRSRLAG